MKNEIIKWWQDVEDYEQDYLRGKLYIVSELNENGNYHMEARSKLYQCKYYMNRNGENVIDIKPNPNRLFDIDKNDEAFPIALKNFKETDFTFSTCFDTKINTKNVKQYADTLEILKWTIEQIKEFHEYRIQ